MTRNEKERARRTALSRSRKGLSLTAHDCWALLGSVAAGRVVFTMNTTPVTWSVSHVADSNAIIVWSQLGGVIAGHQDRDGTVVGYETGTLDPARRTGWTVLVTGTAHLLRGAAAVARYEQLLEPWWDGQPRHVVAIRPETITGRGFHLNGALERR